MQALRRDIRRVSEREDLKVPRLKDYYQKEVVPALIRRFGYKNAMQVPRLDKIVINMGLGDAKDNARALESAVNELSLIAGQKAVVTKARKSIANFKVRTGMNVGAKVTLRGDRMYEYMDKLVSIALPRVRDFRGLSGKSFDGRGNYAMGVKEQLIYPEIRYDKVETVRGMDIIFVTTARTDEEARALLDMLGMPFARD
jgi:large subunit ribosomal protein L5